MQLDKFVFSPFTAGMFDAEKPSAIFVFQHVSSNMHYAARYWDASRYKGPENYPLALTNKLLRTPSDVNVYVLPLVTKVRTTAEKVMNKVVDALTEQGLYRKCIKPLPNKVFSVIPEELFRIYKLTHITTGAVHYSQELLTASSDNVLSRKMVYFNELATKRDKREDALLLFCVQFFPSSPNKWTAEVVKTTASLAEANQTLEELSLQALRDGALVLNRIRTHSPVWYYNNLRRGKNIQVDEYLYLGVNGKLKDPRK